MVDTHDCAEYADIVSRIIVRVNRKEGKMTFAEHLLQLRKGRGLKQPELTEQLGISLRAYQYYESGEREPQLSVLIALADFYNISLDELVCRQR